MSRTFVIGITTIALLAVPFWFADGADQSERRQREGGHPVQPRAARDEAQGATEDGLPGQPEGRARTFEFNPDERFRPGPNWKLGVFAYNTHTGVVITRVAPGTAAARAGLEPGDRIIGVEGFQVGIVGNRMFYLGEELQRQADSRGHVNLLVQNVRNRELLNLPVRLDRRVYNRPAIDSQRLGSNR